MKASELIKVLNEWQARHPREDLDVVVALAMPSMEPIASSPIKGLCFGFDWNHGNLVLRAQDELTIKSENEAAYNMASDLLGYIVTKPTKKQGYEQRTALNIFKLLGKDIMQYQHIFHRDAPKGGL